jgi:hypothetical protein
MQEIFIMDVLHRTEAWKLSGDSLKYSHTTIIIKDMETGQYSFASTTRRFRLDEDVDISELPLNPIPLDDIFPTVRHPDVFVGSAEST